MALHFKAELQSRQAMVKKLLGELVGLMKDPEARSQDNESATDNVVGAVRTLTACGGWW